MDGGIEGWKKYHDPRRESTDICIEIQLVTFVQRFRTLTTPDRETMEKIERKNGVVRKNVIFVSI